MVIPGGGQISSCNSLVFTCAAIRNKTEISGVSC